MEMLSSWASALQVPSGTARQPARLGGDGRCPPDDAAPLHSCDGPATELQAGGGAARRSGTSLQAVLSRDNIAVLLDDPAVCERLYPLLPDNVERTRQELEAVIRSPQFHQAVAALDAGLKSGEVAPLVAQLGLDPNVGGPFGGVDAFLRAIRDQVKRGAQEGSGAAPGPNAPPSER